MPTYEYKCTQCEERFKRYQPITAKTHHKCPKCGGKSKRMIGAGAGIIFKGSGFYETDYKRSSASSRGIPSKEDSPKLEESKEASSDKAKKGSVGNSVKK